MRLLFLIKNLESNVGGAERIFCLLCSTLANRGHSVSVMTFEKPGSKSFFELSPNVKRIYLGVGDSSKKATLLETVKRIWALRGAIKKDRPDMVVGFMHSSFILAAFALFGLKMPLVGSEHIVPEHYKSRPLQFALFIFSSFFMQKITVVSETIKNSYPYVIRRKMSVMPNPISKKTTGIKLNRGASRKKTYSVINVGRLDVQKDQETLIRAFSKCKDYHGNWVLKIFGEGAERQRLEALISGLSMQNNIFMMGVKDDIEQEYRDADIFAITSRYESFGLVTAEAMVHGVPPVGFAACKGTNEIIIHNHSGILVPDGKDRIKSFSDALNFLISNPEIRQEMGRNASSQMENQFSLDKICHKWELLLADLAT